MYDDVVMMASSSFNNTNQKVSLLHPPSESLQIYYVLMMIVSSGGLKLHEWFDGYVYKLTLLRNETRPPALPLLCPTKYNPSDDEKVYLHSLNHIFRVEKILTIRMDCIQKQKQKQICGWLEVSTIRQSFQWKRNTNSYSSFFFNRVLRERKRKESFTHDDVSLFSCDFRELRHTRTMETAFQERDQWMLTDIIMSHDLLPFLCRTRNDSKQQDTTPGRESVPQCFWQKSTASRLSARFSPMSSSAVQRIFRALSIILSIDIEYGFSELSLFSPEI